jgi:hypothetical protein
MKFYCTFPFSVHDVHPAPPESILVLYQDAVACLPKDSPEYVSLWNRLDRVRQFAEEKAKQPSNPLPMNPHSLPLNLASPPSQCGSYLADPVAGPLAMIPRLVEKNKETIFMAWDGISHVLLKISKHKKKKSPYSSIICISIRPSARNKEPKFGDDAFFRELMRLVDEAQTSLKVIRQHYVVNRQVYDLANCHNTDGLNASLLINILSRGLYERCAR